MNLQRAREISTSIWSQYKLVWGEQLLHELSPLIAYEIANAIKGNVISGLITYQQKLIIHEKDYSKILFDGEICYRRDSITFQHYWISWKVGITIDPLTDYLISSAKGPIIREIELSILKSFPNLIVALHPYYLGSAMSFQKED